MGAKQKLKLKNFKSSVITAGQLALANPNAPNLGVPKGVSVQTNASRVVRFPLPLTIGASIGLAVGMLAMLRGHRVVGALALLAGVAGLGAAAAAPELNAALDKARGP